MQKLLTRYASQLFLSSVAESYVLVVVMFTGQVSGDFPWHCGISKKASRILVTLMRRTIAYHDLERRTVLNTLYFYDQICYRSVLELNSQSVFRYHSK